MNVPGIKIAEETTPLFASDGEEMVLRRFIDKGWVVFDIGANVGDWSAMVLAHQPDVTIHCFEPVPETMALLRGKLCAEIASGRVRADCAGMDRAAGSRSFTHYADASTWSTFYRRTGVEKETGLTEAREITVAVDTVDGYCERNGVEHIDFLKVDTEGGELDVLLGAQKMLKSGRIAYIQFEYGGTYLDAGITLRSVFELLESHRFGLFRVSASGLDYTPLFRDELEDFRFANYLAVNERLVPAVLGLPPKMLNLRALLLKHGIAPRGVIHIGAHEGGELRQYAEMGAERVLFIEANPETYGRLAANVGEVGGVLAVQCAVADHNGSVTLHLTSSDQSSSILPLKRHLEVYPGIVEERTVEVPCRTLDTLMQELGLDRGDFNILNMDIQGAELLALRGGEETLRHIEAINSEVNYQELYAGCATVWELDSFLEQRAFDRVATVTPYHPSWGDGFYVRRPVVTMSTLGSNGRFGNQIFQYAFLRIHAQRHRLSYQTAPWIGQRLFGRDDPAITAPLPKFRESTNDISDALIPNSRGSLKGFDFEGYFQYHTSYYAPHKELFRSLFEASPPIRAALDAAYRRLRSLGKTLVGLHLRRTDYGYSYFFVAPSQWYLDWLREIWPTLDDPVLFIASDDAELVLDDFAAYRPVTSRSLGISLEGAEFYPDFHLLSRCDVCAISNSSFSFAACMLNREGRAFYRPVLSSRRLVPFDPWHSEVLLRDCEVPGPQPDRQGEPSILFLNVYYNGFLTHLYQSSPELAGEPYAVQKQRLTGELFGDSDYYSHNLSLHGWRADDLIVNAAPAQAAWAKEHGVTLEGFELVAEQIRRFAPDVLYIHDMYAYPEEFFDAVRKLGVKLVAGQIASPISAGTPFRAYDIVFSSFPHFVERFNREGIKSVLQPLAFEPRVLSRIPRYDFGERPVRCSFVGGISQMHRTGNELLELLVERTPLQIWGYGAESLPAASPLRTRHNGEAWGRGMYCVMASSRIAVNRHIDVAENYANNLRLYEATGCGALLITEYRENLGEMFEIGREVVAYRSPEECARLINYYLAHPAEAQAIAEAGQRRTLRDHAYRVRMERTGALLKEQIDKIRGVR